MNHCRGEHCKRTARDHVLVPVGPDDGIERFEVAVCGCLCPGCDDVNTACGWRAPCRIAVPRQMEMF